MSCHLERNSVHLISMMDWLQGTGKLWCPGETNTVYQLYFHNSRHLHEEWKHLLEDDLSGIIMKAQCSIFVLNSACCYSINNLSHAVHIFNKVCT